MKGAIEIQKDSSGYVLHFNHSTRIQSMAISGCLFLLSTEREIENMKNCLFIRLRHKEDEQALRESGLLSFCHAQMAEDDKK